MNAVVDWVAYWLADFYLAATVLLAAALGAMAVCRQPAKRLAVAKAVIVALTLLAGLCVLPGWSLVSLEWTAAEATANVSDSRRAIEVAPAELAPVVEIGAAAEVAVPAVQTGPVASGPSVLWLTVLVASYVVGCGVVAAWLLVGMVAAWRLVRRAESASVELNELRAADDDGPSCVELLVSREIDVAVAIGVWRPRVLLPKSWLESRSADELRVILAHELAHVRNGDLYWLALSRLLLVLLWAQPLYWWLRRQMRLDQEALADAAAAERTGRRQYAEQLVAWAREVSIRPRPLLPASVGLWEGASQLRRRVAVLLDERLTVLRTCSAIWQSVMIALAMAVVITSSVFSFSPLDEASNTFGKEVEPPEMIRSKIDESLKRYPSAKLRLGPLTIEGCCADETGMPLSDIDAALLFKHELAKPKWSLVGRTKTRAHGQFRFSQLEKPGSDAMFRTSYWILAWSPGRRSYIANWFPEMPPQSFEFSMGKASAVSGRVVDYHDNPVAGAWVRFDHHLPIPIEGLMADRTDENGEFIVADLRAIRASDLVRDLGNGIKEVHNLRFQVEHPDFAFANVTYQEVPSKVDVTLRPAAEISGRVLIGATNLPAPNVAVKLQDANNSRQGRDYNPTHWAEATTDSQGNYTLTNLRAGKYNIWADEPDWTVQAIDSLELKMGEKRRGPDLKLVKGGILAGQLVDADTGEDVAVDNRDVYVSVGVHGPSRPRSGAAIDGGRVNSDGTFKFRLPAGKHYVYMSGVGPFTVQGKDHGARELEVRDGETTHTEFRVRREN